MDAWARRCVRYPKLARISAWVALSNHKFIILKSPPVSSATLASIGVSLLDAGVTLTAYPKQDALGIAIRDHSQQHDMYTSIHSISDDGTFRQTNRGLLHISVLSPGATISRPNLSRSVFVKEQNYQS
jgi:hypothetical protein